MESIEFKEIRAKFKKTQKELAEILGVSIKAIHSYEQGWRRIPHHVERQLLYLFSKIILGKGKSSGKCWDILDCPDDMCQQCPAWEFDSGDLCWFINGTKCSGTNHKSWEEKMKECRNCKVFKELFGNKIKGIK